MSVHVCARCGIPVWSPPDKFCGKCWEHFHRKALKAITVKGKK